MMKIRWVAILAALAICAGVQPADGQGYLKRLGKAVAGKGVKAAGAIACTVVAGPVAASAESRESDWLCLDTSIQMQVLWIRASSSDRPKVDKDVTLGSSVVIWNSSSVLVQERQVVQANGWKAVRKGNPARSNFLKMDSVRLPLLAWALREKPDVARHFGLNFHTVAQQLPAVQGLFRELGQAPDSSSQPSQTSTQRGGGLLPEPDLLACRAVLRRTRGTLDAVGRLAREISDDHHGGILGKVQSGVLAIDDFFDAHPVGVQ